MNKYEELSKYKIQVTFKYNKVIVADLRLLIGSDYDKGKKQNTLLIGKENVDAIRVFTAKHKFYWNDVVDMMTLAKQSSLFRILANGEALFPFSKKHNADLKQAGYHWDGSCWSGGSRDDLSLEWWFEQGVSLNYGMPNLQGGSPEEIIEELERLSSDGKFLVTDDFWDNATDIIVNYKLGMNPDGSGFDNDAFLKELESCLK